MGAWPAKLLLFGEYTVLLKGEALAIPLHQRTGRWSISASQHPALPAWSDWLIQLDRHGRLPWPVRVGEFGQFILAGGAFDTDIPAGYGLGSSGAVVAALVDVYGSDLPEDPDLLARGLAQLESYFHGSSSGLDPLVSLTGRPVYRDEAGRFQPVDLPRLPEGLFLVDSGQPRQTAHLVQIFHRKLEQEAERTMLLMDLMPQVHRAVQAIRNGDVFPFQDAFSAISRMQARLFPDMIPEELRSFWEGPTHHLKLCGAGGGGYFLGHHTDKHIPELPFPVIPLADLL